MLLPLLAETVCGPPFLYPSSYPSESWRARSNTRRSRCRPRRRSHRCMLIGSFSIDHGDGCNKRHFEKNAFSFFQTLSRLIHFAENIKCRLIFLELISWEPHSSLERKRKIRRRLFMSSIKREIRYFRVVVVQWQQSVIVLNKPIAFWRFRCRRRRRCLSFPLRYARCFLLQ